MSMDRISTTDYTIPSIRSKEKVENVKIKPPQKPQPPPSSLKAEPDPIDGNDKELDEGLVDYERGGNVYEKNQKESDVPSSKILTSSQSISKQNSISDKQQEKQRRQKQRSKKEQQKLPTPTTATKSKEQFRTAEHIQQQQQKSQNPNQHQLPNPQQQQLQNPQQQQLQNPQQQQLQNPQQHQQQQHQTDTTQKSVVTEPLQQQQKPKNSVSEPEPISPSTKASILNPDTPNTNENNNIKSGSYIKVDSAYKRARAAPQRSRSGSNTPRGVASLDNGISQTSFQPSTQTTKACIEWDEKKLVTKINLNSKKAPQIFCFNIRWILLLWGFLLCCYDSTMLMMNIFHDVVFLEHTYHYVFFLTLPSGPALFYLMISEKVSIIGWKTHISCQIFRVILNIYLFLDYYCAWLDSLDALTAYHQITIVYENYVETKWVQKIPDPEIEKYIRTYFAVFLSVLGIVTVLTIIMFGFAINLYYYEKEALKKKREKWRRRINKILESHQTFIPPETEEMSSDIASSAKYPYASKK